MPRESAIMPVVTWPSPSSLKRRRLSARTRPRVRSVRMALPSTRSAMMAASLSRRAREPAVQVAERAPQVRGGARERPAARRAAEVDREPAMRIGEHVVAVADAVARQHRRQLGLALHEVAARALVGVLADALARRVTEYVREEDLAVVGLGLEEQHIPARILGAVLGEARRHARVDHRAEGL